MSPYKCEYNTLDVIFFTQGDCMSIDATRFVWKLSKNVISPIEKLILLAIADRCGERGECWPSIARLSQDTLLHRDTILQHRKRLIEIGILRLTGEMKGRGKQIPVMQMMVDEWREGEYIEDEIDQSLAPTGRTERLVPVVGNDTYQSLGTTRNLKEEPKQEPKIIYTQNNFFEEYKQQEKEIIKATTELNHASKFKELAISNQRCQKTFNDLWLKLNITIDEAYDACQSYWETKGEIANWGRFLNFLKNPNSLKPFTNSETSKTSEIKKIANPFSPEQMETIKQYQQFSHPSYSKMLLATFGTEKKLNEAQNLFIKFNNWKKELTK